MGNYIFGHYLYVFGLGKGFDFFKIKPQELAKIYGITERRVQQLAKEFKETK